MGRNEPSASKCTSILTIQHIEKVIQGHIAFTVNACSIVFCVQGCVGDTLISPRRTVRASVTIDPKSRPHCTSASMDSW
jgi:hypothetical protein